MKARETVRLDSRAQHRLLVLNHILAVDLTAAEATTHLRLSGDGRPLATARADVRLLGSVEGVQCPLPTLDVVDGSANKPALAALTSSTSATPRESERRGDMLNVAAWPTG